MIEQLSDELSNSPDNFIKELEEDKRINRLANKFFSWDGLLREWDDTEQELVDAGENKREVSLARLKAQSSLDRLKVYNQDRAKELSRRYRENPKMGYSSIIEDNFF